MDYVVGGVAALISGNVTTPNRPKLLKKAPTPTKRQQSPNVTPKSELVGDRSIFLSPSLQKKKAIVKKSPKRIFENQDMDVTVDGDGVSSLISPKADKVKKHLQNVLDADPVANNSPKSPKGRHNKSIDVKSPKKTLIPEAVIEDVQITNESTPKKKKKSRISVFEVTEIVKNDNVASDESKLANVAIKSPKKKQKTSVSELTENMEIDENNISINTGTTIKMKSTKKRKMSEIENETIENQTAQETNPLTKKKKNKRKNKKSNKTNNQVKTETAVPEKKRKKTIVNPNAITTQDSDSEHESDNEIESETEQSNKEILDTGPVEESSDEEEEPKPKKREKIEREEDSEDEVKRTLFVGNVPYSNKTKKEIKKIFMKYGDIDTVRIRTVPVKDARMTPKVAAIKNELHPDRTTVNVYVKFLGASSVDKALVENNTRLNDYHLRVTRSDTTGAAHDPRRSVFIGNLPFALEDDALRSKFESCGDIESVRIIRDKTTNAGKGFGYVNFTSKDGVELALALSEEDLTIKNRILRVQRCTQATHKQSQNARTFQNGKEMSGGFQGRNQGGQDRGRGFQGRGRGFQGRGRGFQGRGRGFQGRNQGFQGEDRNDSVQDQNSGFRGSSRGFRGGSQGFRGRSEGGRGRSEGGRGRGQGGRGRGEGGRGRGQGGRGRSQGVRGRSQGFQGRSEGFQGRSEGFQGRSEGFQGRHEGGGGHNNDEGAYRRIMKKKQNQEEGEGPSNKKEKKPRKEFVGLTSEKKKKHKVNKGDKTKKALSEILTK